jgi:quercetin dioxygenase-like cupin family protein
VAHRKCKKWTFPQVRFLSIVELMIPRRDVLEGLFKTGLATLGSSMTGTHGVQAAKTCTVFKQRLPSISLDHLNLTVLEVDYPAGGFSHSNCYPGFVVGYVLEGEVRFKLKGQAERTYRTGQVFYEAPDSVHLVAANASMAKPARVLALIFTQTSGENSVPA